MKRLILAIATTATVSACASTPSAIAPVAMGNAFAATSCTTARNLLAEKRTELATLSEQQRAAVVGDAIGVFLVLIPVSSLTGADREGAIATAKGQIIALEARLTSC